MPPAKPSTPVLNTLDPTYTGLLLALPLSDGTGTVATDLSGNNHPGTLTGGATWVNDSTLGTVLQLDGTSGFVTLDTAISAILNAQTTASVAFWLMLRNATPATQAKAGLCTIQSLSGSGAATFYPNTDGKMYSSVFRQTSRVNAITLGAATRTSWHHLAITQISNGNYVIYQNGVAVSTTAGEFGVSAALAPFLGKSVDSGGDYFLDGWIGDFRVWTRVLAAPEVLGLFNNPWGLYTPSAQQAQIKILEVQAEVTDEFPVTLRQFETQPESQVHNTTTVNATALMVDMVPATSFPYNIGDGKDARYKPISPTLYPDAITSGLTLAIPFVEGSGTTAADYSGSALTGTLTNGVTWNTDTTSPFLKPTLVRAPDVAFPNNNSFVSIPSNAAVEQTTAITLAAWVVVGANQGKNMVIFSKLNDAAGLSPNVGATWSYIVWQGSDAKFHFQIADTIDSTPANVVNSTNTFSNGTLCHVVATYDSVAQQMKLYVNGNLEGSTADAGLIPYNSNGTHALYVGNDELSISNSNFWRWPGRIDDVRVWGRAITATEVTQLYRGAFGIYTNFAQARDLAIQLEVCPEFPVSVRTFEVQAEADYVPTTNVRATAIMVDLVPAVRNANFGLSSISPIVGVPAGGTTVTVRGYNLTGTTQILVGGVPLTSLTVVNNNTVTGVTGAHVAGLVDVQVSVTGMGTLIMPNAFAYAPGFNPTANLGLVGAQFDTSFIVDTTYTNEATPNWPLSDTTLSFTLPDVPVSPACVDLYVRRVGQQGAMWMRQGNIYSYTVDLVNKKIIWKTSAPFALLTTDEITVVFLAQGN